MCVCVRVCECVGCEYISSNFLIIFVSVSVFRVF